METRDNIDKIIDAFIWLKENNYKYADEALRAFNLEFETTFKYVELNHTLEIEVEN